MDASCPADPSPSWQGYSVGRWEGDTLVVDTAGFNDRGWLDARGTGHSTEMRVEERFRRRDYGHLDLTITITDPKTFTSPITFSVVEELLPDTDLFEHYCLENEKDDAHFPGRVSKVSPADLFSDAAPRQDHCDAPVLCKTLNASKNRP